MARRVRPAAARTTVVAVLAMLAAACGARLSPAQQAALDAQGNRIVVVQGTTAPGSSTLSTGTGTTSGSGSAGTTTGAGSGGGTGAGTTTGTSTRSTTGTSAGSTTGTGTSTGTGATAPSSSGPKGGSAPVGGETTYGIDAKTGTVSIDPAVCKAPPAGTGVSATEIDLGNVSTLTGPIPGIFLGALHGAQAFATYINSIGGICGRKLVIKSGDDNLQVSQNAASTQQLSSQVFAFVGSFSADDAGGAQVLKANGMPDIGQSLAYERFSLPNNFAPEPIDGWNIAPYQWFAKLEPEAAQHMAILGANQPVGHAEYVNNREAMVRAGMKIVYDDPNIEPTQTDYSSDAQAMKAAGAQGIVWAATAGVMADTAKAIQNAGISPFPLPLYGTTAYDQGFLQQAGSAADGMMLYLEEAMFQGEDAAVVPMIGTFDKYYQALYHQAPDEYAMYSWMSGLLFIQGLNNGGAINQKSLLAGLKKVTSFDAGGMVATDNPAAKKPPTCYIIIRLIGGKFVRDSANPTGFNCQYAPNYYFAPH